jgi:Leucine-rich repeat (LRR) protein
MPKISIKYSHKLVDKETSLQIEDWSDLAKLYRDDEGTVHLIYDGDKFRFLDVSGSSHLYNSPPSPLLVSRLDPGERGGNLYEAKKEDFPLARVESVGPSLRLTFYDSEGDGHDILFHRSEIETLSLFGQAIRLLPAEICQLTGLKKLDLTYAELSSLPPSLSQLSKLEHLILEYNQLSSLPSVSLPRLKKLQLGDNRMTSGPDLNGFRNLLELRLENNYLERCDIDSSYSLRALVLTNNRLTEFPDPSALGGLFDLRLENNRISSLPETIGQLSSLRVLKLSNNRLTRLPESIGELTTLKYLSLRENQLTGLPESIGGLTKLEALVLGKNSLSEVPSTLCQLTSLKTLMIQNNRLREMPDCVCDLTTLETFDIRGNSSIRPAGQYFSRKEGIEHFFKENYPHCQCPAPLEYRCWNEASDCVSSWLKDSDLRGLLDDDGGPVDRSSLCRALLALMREDGGFWNDKTLTPKDCELCGEVLFTGESCLKGDHRLYRLKRCGHIYHGSCLLEYIEEYPEGACIPCPYGCEGEFRMKSGVQH